MGIIGQTDLCVFWCNVLKKKSSASVRNVKLESIHEENQTNSNWGNYAKKTKNKMAWMPQEFHCHKRQRCLVNGSRLKRLKRYYN